MAVFLGCTNPALCKTYKCKDADGNTVFFDTACNTVAREHGRWSLPIQAIQVSGLIRMPYRIA